MQMILSLLMFVTFISPEVNETIRIKNFEIEIPENLERIKANERYNELLSLKYKDELKILITDDIGSPDKDEKRKNIYDALDLLTTTFEIKYNRWYSTYNGYEKGALSKENINSFKARTRDFKAKINGTVIYFEISTINIGNYYFDLIVTGKEDSRATHKALVKELVNSIKKISEN